MLQHCCDVATFILCCNIGPISLFRLLRTDFATLTCLITTKIVIFYTPINTGFEHFFYSNRPNKPIWHVKDLARLLIAFCGKFCSFCKLIMPKFLSQLNLEEAKINSKL